VSNRKTKRAMPNPLLLYTGQVLPFVPFWVAWCTIWEKQTKCYLKRKTIWNF